MDRADLARLLGTELAAGEPRDVSISEADPGHFMEAFGRGVAAGGRVFLSDPAWGARERAQFLDLVHRYADRVVALNQGQLVFDGPPSEISDQKFRDIYGKDAERVG